MKYVLDIGAGKFNSELQMYDCNWTQHDHVVIVHIDRCYPVNNSYNVDSLVNQLVALEHHSDRDYDEISIEPFNRVVKINNHWVIDLFCRSDVFGFMDNFSMKPFDKIVCNRMFEHLEYCGGEVGRMLEACNAISKNTATLEFVVPNAELLANMLLMKKTLSDNDVMIINTEFCNGKFDPHASVWTPRLAYKYIDQEATWKITKIVEKYPFAGRDIYMKVWCEKPIELQYNGAYDNGDNK